MTACCLCGASPATVQTRPMNALPVGASACLDCRQAIKRCEAGVVRREDGSLHVTDSRVADEPEREPIVPGGLECVA